MTDERHESDPGRRLDREAPTETRAGAGPPRLPRKIGPFHIKDVLAWGGMGVVYRAVQEQPRRTVALKLMKHGIASRSAMRRFQYESQILARLHHPGIAQIYAAGTHDDGSGPVPYFAMEYVPNARTITRYAGDKDLDTRKRLEIFATVCDAVQHGHQKGIIHRDLKPDNILVDPGGQVKIIDFGVARGTDSDLAVTTLQTEVGQLIGTLQYMSPEQCDADPDAIDARSDVYTLGVVLYELLTGRLPYEVGVEPVFRGTEVIRSTQPEKPGTIDRSLKGDVETIVLQALEKDPGRRYASARALSEDIKRYLAGDPIRARPPSAVYRAGLFARRHRTALATSTLLALVILTASILLLRSQARTRHALERASRAEEAATSTRSGASDRKSPRDMVGKTPPPFSLTSSEGETVGTVNLPDHKAAVINFVAADCPYCLKQVPLVERIRAEYEPKGVLFLNVLGRLMDEFTVHEGAAIFARYGSRIDIARDEDDRVEDLFHVRGVPALVVMDGSGTVQHVTIGAHPGLMARLRGQLDALLLGIPTPEEKLAQDEELYRKTLESNLDTLGEGHRDTLQAMENLAVTLVKSSEFDEAEDLYRDMWDIRARVLGERDPETLDSMHKLAVVLYKRGKPAEAESLHRRTLAIQEEVLGPDHPAIRLSMAHLGMSLRAQDKTEGADPYIAELVELRRRQAQARDASAETLNEYAWLLLSCEVSELRDPETALVKAEAAAALSGRQEAEILDTLALAQRMTGDLDGAIATQKEAIALIPAAEVRKRMPYERTLAEFYREAGRLGELEAWYRDSLARTRSAMPPGSLGVGLSLSALGRFLLDTDQDAEAEPVFREILEIAQDALPENHWRLLIIESALGQSLAGQARFEEAEQLLVNAYERMKGIPEVPGEERRLALQRVIQLYEDWGRAVEAARYRALHPEPGL